MKKILFCVLPESGHINPYIGPAQALQERGHEIIFVAPKDLSKRLKSCGLSFDQSWCDETEPSLPMRGRELVELIQNKKKMKEWIKSLLLGVSDDTVKKFVEHLKSLQPDVMVIDPLFYAAVIAAEVAGIKWVSMSNSLNPVLPSHLDSDLLRTLSEIDHDRRKMFARFGVHNVQFSGCDVLSNHLTIAFCTKELAGREIPHVKMVGPSLPLNLRGDESEALQNINRTKPLVYASFGSQIYYWPDIFDKLIEACRDLNVQLALSVGDLKSTMMEKFLPNFVELYEYAPQLSVLPKAQIFITHGGANSFMEAIYHATPVLLSPMCNDQFHQAHFVEETGIGQVLDLQVATVLEIKEAIQELLQGDHFKIQMRKISDSYQVDGSRQSAEWVESIL